MADIDPLFQNNIQKPGRYIGREWNVSKKAFDSAPVKVCLCFPDLYEVGMSNLGVRILYGIMNRDPHVVCERCFAPAVDFEAGLAAQGVKLFSLESRKPLDAFDIVGFSLGHELSYTNVLAMLAAGGIPFAASERTHVHPLVIGGGPCMANPEPMHEFFDAFVIGEGEEVLMEVLELYGRRQEQYKSGAFDKTALLNELAAIEGVYVPSLHGSGTAVVKKRYVCDFESSFYPAEWIVPYIAIVHDRITLEVMRGCPNQCRFCQARVQYHPLRLRKPATVKAQADKAYACTGYEEIALAGLSVSDYPYLEELLGALIPAYKEQGVSVALPSIKPKALVGSMSALIASIKKTGLTFAPEVGSPALRKALGKDFSDEELYSTLRQAYAAGYQHVKLYFMTGLPGEKDEDLDAIVAMALEVSRLRKEVSGKYAQVNISINTLIPKPHTPLQWMGMEPPEETARKQQYLRDKIRKHKWIKVNFHDQSMSWLEGIFSRGDRRLSAVVMAAFRKGCRFDAWQEHLSMDKWRESFTECGIDPAAYLAQKDTTAPLPWDFLDMGVPKGFLLEEYGKAMNKPVDMA